MNNNELTKALLCEATELLTEAAEILNEGGSRHIYAKNLQDKESRLKKLIDHSSGERRNVYEQELRKVQEELRDKCTGANKGGYNSKTPIHYMKGTLDGKYINSERTRTDDGGQTFTFSHPSDQRYQGKGGRLAKNNFNDAFKGKEGSELNKRITERGKKSQNESIAVLLTEAALLLNEGIFKKKNNSTYNGGFEPDYVEIPNADIEWQKKLIENQKKVIVSETDLKRKEKLKKYLSTAEEDLKRLQEKYNR